MIDPPAFMIRLEVVEELDVVEEGLGPGLVAGLVGGKKIKVEDAAIGAVIGYIGGSVIKGPTEVHDVDLKPGTDMGVLLGKRLSYYRVEPKPVVAAPKPAPKPTAKPAAKPGKVKYYSYQGHPWKLDLSTGKRTRLD